MASEHSRPTAKLQRVLFPEGIIFPRDVGRFLKDRPLLALISLLTGMALGMAIAIHNVDSFVWLGVGMIAEGAVYSLQRD